MHTPRNLGCSSTRKDIENNTFSIDSRDHRFGVQQFPRGRVAPEPDIIAYTDAGIVLAIRFDQNVMTGHFAGEMKLRDGQTFIADIGIFQQQNLPRSHPNRIFRHQTYTRSTVPETMS